MKNQIEIWQCLGEGAKIKHRDMINGEYVHLIDGNLCDETGKKRLQSFSNYKEWQVYIDPSQAKKFYRRKWIIDKDGDLQADCPWCVTKDRFDSLVDGLIVSPEWMEIEI